VGKQARLRAERRIAELLDSYAAVASEYLPQWFAASRCLNATRITIEVLAQFGVATRAQPTQVLVMNEVMWREVTRRGRLPESEAESLEWMNAFGAYSVGVTGEAADDLPPGYPAHLIAVADGYLIDAAARQFHRPAHEIYTPEVLLTRMTRSTSPWIVEGPNGTVISYQALDDQSYRTVAGFQRSAHNLDAADAIARRVRAKKS